MRIFGPRLPDAQHTMEIITSGKNQKIRFLLELQQKSQTRRESGLFVVEGRREIEHCIGAGFALDSLFICQSAEQWASSLNTGGVSLFGVSDDVYSKIAYRESTEGAVACFKSKACTLDGLVLPDNPLIVVLESVEKPGNLGAVLRSADAAGVDAVIVCDPLTDLYNPNLIRASIGAVFTVPCAVCTSEQAIDYLKARGVHILTAQLQDSSLYYESDMKAGTAIVMGTESTGLTGVWRKAADAHIRIPMLGRLDSLNVSVSAAILMFEAVRQRRPRA